MRHARSTIALCFFAGIQCALARAADGPRPCRIHDGPNRDILVMTLGDVATPVAQGTFDSSHDRVRMNDGVVVEHYYRDTLGIKFFQPIDKSVFPHPPSGWCSWYFYFNEISGDEVLRNARWLADNLKDFGLEYVQIDDGWQGLGRGMNTNRDWTTINDRFPGGMKAMATKIKQLGFKPGIWIAPHGQSSEAFVAAHRAAFLLGADGKTLSDTWEGTYLLDPSTAAAHEQLKTIFTGLADSGYEYFKIDGQPCVIDEYKRCAAMMHTPTDDPVKLYRNTLGTIRGAIGPQRYLLGCWEAPREGIGMTNGWRTGADVVPGWNGFLIARDATLGYYFLHNVVMYCDPDTVMVHQPLTIEQARAWATLQGLTGQALMASDRMMDLSSERVELLRRIYPAADIRPFDLYRGETEKHIWDLKINHLGRKYDVVGLFNYDASRAKTVYLNWQELGIADNPVWHELGMPGDGPVHVYDFWNKEYLGACAKGYAIEIPPASCKVLTLTPTTEHIELVSTSRHITQGPVELTRLERDAKGALFKGASRLVKNDPYRLTFAFSVGKNFEIAEASAGSLPVTIANHQGWASVEFTSPKTEEVAWSVRFAAVAAYHFPCNNPGNLEATVAGLDEVSIHWNLPGTSSVGNFLLSLDGKVLGATRGNQFPLGRLEFGRNYKVEVVSGWDDGTVSNDRPTKFVFTLDSLLKASYCLTDLRPLHPLPDCRTEPLHINRSAAGKPLSIGGTILSNGLGCKTGDVIEYELQGKFHMFNTNVGIDDAGHDRPVTFIVEGDGKVLDTCNQESKKNGCAPLSADVRGVKRLVLRTTSPAGAPGDNSVDWGMPTVSQAPPHRNAAP